MQRTAHPMLPLYRAAASPGVRFGHEVAALGGVRLITWSQRPGEWIDAAPPPPAVLDTPQAVRATADGAWVSDDALTTIFDDGGKQGRGAADHRAAPGLLASPAGWPGVVRGLRLDRGYAADALAV